MITTLGKGQWRVGVSIVCTSLLHVAHLSHVRYTRICSAIVYVHRAHILASSARSVGGVCVTHGIDVEEVASLAIHSSNWTWSQSRAQQRIFARINAVIAHLTLEYTRQHLAALASLTVYWVESIVATNHHRILSLGSLPRQQLTHLVTLAVIQVYQTKRVVHLCCIVRMCASLISNDNTIFQCQWGSVLGIGIELHVTRSTHRLRDTHGRRKRTRHKAEVIVVHQLTYRVCSLASVVGMVDKERMPFTQELLVALAVLEVRVARHLVVLTDIVVLHTLLQFGYVRSVLLHLLRHLCCRSLRHQFQRFLDSSSVRHLQYVVVAKHSVHLLGGSGSVVGRRSGNLCCRCSGIGSLRSFVCLGDSRLRCRLGIHCRLSRIIGGSRSSVSSRRRSSRKVLRLAKVYTLVPPRRVRKRMPHVLARRSVHLNTHPHLLAVRDVVKTLILSLYRPFRPCRSQHNLDYLLFVIHI